LANCHFVGTIRSLKVIDYHVMLPQMLRALLCACTSPETLALDTMFDFSSLAPILASLPSPTLRNLDIKIHGGAPDQSSLDAIVSIPSLPAVAILKSLKLWRRNVVREFDPLPTWPIE